MTCKSELERRLRSVLPKLEQCESNFITEMIRASFTPSILGNNQKNNWEHDYTNIELSKVQPSDEEIHAYTE